MARITAVNLADLPADERAAIEQDKHRWHEAWQMILKKRPDEIRAWLMRQTDDELREDMRRRLNVVRRNQVEIKNNQLSASQIKRTG
nr:MAG TPA: DNA polymerase III, theta subunit [Caudoviricetes sp.]